MFLLIITLLSLGIFLVYLFLIWNFNYWNRKGIPGPKPEILYGTFPSSLTKKRNLIFDYHDIYDEFKGTTPVVGCFLNRTPILTIIAPDLAKDVFVRYFKHFQNNASAEKIKVSHDPLIGRNPMFLRDQAWKEKRNEITPAFTTGRIKAMFPAMVASCEKMIHYMKRVALQNPKDGFDIKDLTTNYTIDVIATCIYGIKSDAFTEKPNTIRDMGSKLFEASSWFFIYFNVISLFPFIQRFYYVPTINQKVQQFFVDLVKDAVDLRQKNKIDRDDYLNYLLQLKCKKELSDMDMAAHTTTFFFDGYETSSDLISHALYSLAANPATQDKLRAEIITNISKNEDFSYDTLMNLPYLDQLMHETLRMYPPGMALQKRCSENLEIKLQNNKSFTLEKGTITVIPLRPLHYDPDYFENPYQFNPDRFNPENGGIKRYRDQGVFFPFGDGPRICLGMKFGLIQTKVAVVDIVRRFSITVNSRTQEPITPQPRLFLNYPIGGFWLDFKEL